VLLSVDDGRQGTPRAGTKRPHSSVSCGLVAATERAFAGFAGSALTSAQGGDARGLLCGGVHFQRRRVGFLGGVERRSAVLESVPASPPSSGKSASPAKAGPAVIGCSIVAIDDLFGSALITVAWKVLVAQQRGIGGLQVPTFGVSV
jgi:hypothetical protein